MKSNKQIILKIKDEIEKGTFEHYDLKDSNNFFSDAYDFLDKNKLFIIPIFNELHDIRIIKLKDLNNYTLSKKDTILCDDHNLDMMLNLNIKKSYDAMVAIDSTETKNKIKVKI